jgi:hypothetical protein
MRDLTVKFRYLNKDGTWTYREDTKYFTICKGNGEIRCYERARAEFRMSHA